VWRFVDNDGAPSAGSAQCLMARRSRGFPANYSGRAPAARSSIRRAASRPPACEEAAAPAVGTAATLALKAGVPVHVVSDLLGHSSVSVTWDVYGHVLEDQRSDAADAIGAQLAPLELEAEG
jgi:integrase